MTEILVIYEGEDTDERERVHSICMTKTMQHWFETRRLGPSAFLMPSGNINEMRLKQLRETVHRGTLHWIRIEGHMLQSQTGGAQ
jgi:hypothetical protein